MIPSSTGAVLHHVRSTKSHVKHMCVRFIGPTRSFHENPRYEDPIKNFEDFKVPNQVGMFEHHKLPKSLLDVEFNYPVCRDTMQIRWPGYWFKKKFVYVKEMEPELVVPDLEGFNLKPYVSHRTEELDTEPFTAKKLFNHVYADRVTQAYREHKIESLEVTPESIDQSRLKALQTGADLFGYQPPEIP